MIKTINKEEFLNTISSLRKTEDMSLVEAICQFCEDRGIDPEDITPLIDTSLKNKLENEAIQRNIIKSNTSVLTFS